MSGDLERIRSFVDRGRDAQAAVNDVLANTRIWIPDRSWKALEGWPCRFTIGPGHRTCGRDSVAGMYRGSIRRHLWAYCDLHLYGRRWDPERKIVLVEVAADSRFAKQGYAE